MSTRVIDLNVKIKVNSVSLPTPVVEPKSRRLYVTWGGGVGLGVTTR